MGRLATIAWRNVWRNRRRTVIAVIAIALALALMLFFDGLLGGAKQAIYGNTVKLQGGNVQVHAPGYRERAKRLPLLPLADPDAVIQAASAQPKVVAASQRIETSGMLSSREGTLPVVITGVEPEQTAAVSLIAQNVVDGRYLAAGDEDVILVGQALAEQLQVGVGDRIALIGRATHEQMRRRTMTIVGIYDIGIAEVEKGMAYVSLAEVIRSIYDDTNSLDGTKVPDTLSLANINAQVDSAFTTQMADSVATDGTIATREQALYQILQFLTERSVSGTTVTVRKVDGSTSLFTLTLDDGTTPTDITRS